MTISRRCKEKKRKKERTDFKTQCEFSINLSGHIADFVGFLTLDPSLLCNTDGVKCMRAADNLNTTYVRINLLREYYKENITENILHSTVSTCPTETLKRCNSMYVHNNNNFI